MAFVYVALGFMGFLAATTLAIDVGMFMTARSQAQNSADAGALAGATALVFNSYTDRSASGPAVQGSVQAALANQVVGAPVSVTPADVSFPTVDRVQVNVYRTNGDTRNNAVPTLMGTFFGVKTVNITATGTAEAAPANAVTCVKPFMIPDRWIEKQTPPFDPDDSFDMFANGNKGAPLSNPDIYIGPGQSGYTGYDAVRDKGTQIMIRAGTGNNIEPSMYYSWKMPQGQDIGGDYYRGNIAFCNPTVAHIGDTLIQEPGNMSGPTMQGIDDLIAADPNAYWDDATDSVHTTMHPTPRIFPIPLYDPADYAVNKKNGRTAEFKAANWLGFFVEYRSGNNIFGRITPILGVIDKGAGPAPAGAFPRAIRLVQ